MKINGYNLLFTGNTLPVEELNLRDGQTIVGKVISTSADEALLEMAGRGLQAKIEGNPEIEPGAVLKFLVNHDEQGRVLLKVLSNAPETNSSVNNDFSGKTAIDPNLQKAVAAALNKEGISSTPEQIQNYVRQLQSFQSKYQQVLPPQVLASVVALKLPVNPETIMTAWLFQDTDLRDLLWNILQQSSPNQSEAGILARLIFGMSSKPEELQTKLETLAKQLDSLIRNLNGKPSGANPFLSQNRTVSDILFRQLFVGDNTELSPAARQLLTKQTPETALRQFNSDHSSDPNLKNSSNQILGRTGAAPELPKTPLINELKQLISRLTETFGQKDLRDKIEVLLDRNLALNKAVTQDNGINGNYNLIPLLVNDSQNMLHEVLIKWREESNPDKDGGIDQILQMNIPTENLGEIHLSLRTGKNGTHLTFKVNNEEVRKYLLRNLAELKESVNRKDLLIKVAFEPKENDCGSALNGVDLWI